MRNYELFSPNCPYETVAELVRRYALRKVFDGVGWSNAELLQRQHEIYEDWCGEDGEQNCGFYEWMLRDADLAFVLAPGDLVMYNGAYCVVTGRQAPGAEDRPRICSKGFVRQAPWPKPAECVDLKTPDGRTRTVRVDDKGLKPADIPPEV